MKVCVINDKFSLSGGGGQYRILGIARQLQKSGFEIELCCPYFTVTNLYDFPEVRQEVNWFHFQYANTIRLLKNLKKLDYDVVLIELPCPVTKGLATYYANYKGTRTFIDFGDIWYSDETGFLHKWINTYLIKKVCNKADGISVTTSAMKKLLERLLPGTKIEYAPCGVDLDLFDPSKTVKFRAPELEGKKVVLYQGTVSTFTGCHYIPEIAIKTIAKNRDVIFMIVGDGPYLNELKRQVLEKGLNKFFYFAGRVAHQSMPSYVKAADIAIAPFPQKEDINLGVFPLKVIETMAMGKPVVSTDIEEVKNIITNGHDGFYVPLEEMDKLIVAILGNTETLGKIGRNARETAISKYDWKVICRSLIDFWKINFHS